MNYEQQHYLYLKHYLLYFLKFLKLFFLIVVGFDHSLYDSYSRLGEIWDLTTVATSFITFSIYCLMSQQFRKEMYKLVLPKCSRIIFNSKASNHILTDGIRLTKSRTSDPLAEL